MNLPVAIYYEDTNLSYYDSNRDKYLTPYSDHTRIMASIAKHNIKIPFEKIITRADGLSTCPFCKATYAGDQGKCTNMVTHFRFVGSYHDEKTMDLVQVGDSRKGQYDSYPKKVESAKTDKCGTETKWSLYSEFSEQYSFFEFVSFVDSIDIYGTNLLQKYGNTLPLGTLNEYRIKNLEQQNMSLQADLMKTMQALKMVAEKMNAAGHQLMF